LYSLNNNKHKNVTPSPPSPHPKLSQEREDNKNKRHVQEKKLTWVGREVDKAIAIRIQACSLAVNGLGSGFESDGTSFVSTQTSTRSSQHKLNRIHFTTSRTSARHVSGENCN